MNLIEYLGVRTLERPMPNDNIRVLSVAARQLWKEVVERNLDIIHGMPTPDSWLAAFDLVYQECRYQDKPFLNPAITDRVAFNSAFATASAKRSTLVRSIDRAKVMENCKLSGIDRTCDLTDEGIRFTSKCHIELYKKMDEDEFEALLRNANFLYQPGGHFVLSPLGGGIIRFTKDSQSGYDLEIIVIVSTDHLPETMFKPLPKNDGALERYFMREVWMKLIRRFPIQTLTRRAML